MNRIQIRFVIIHKNLWFFKTNENLSVGASKYCKLSAPYLLDGVGPGSEPGSLVKDRVLSGSQRVVGSGFWEMLV